MTLVATGQTTIIRYPPKTSGTRTLKQAYTKAITTKRPVKEFIPPPRYVTPAPEHILVGRSVSARSAGAIDRDEQLRQHTMLVKTQERMNRGFI